MATYADLKSRVARELGRRDLESDIDAACKAGIRLYRGRRFRFNELTATMNTIAGQAWYGVSSGLPAGIQEVDSITVDQWGQQTALCQRAYSELEALDTAQSMRSAPDFWCWYGERLRLWPVPDRVYPLALSCVATIPAPASDDAENAWTGDAEALIRAFAVRTLARDVIRDPEKEAAGERAEIEALRTLDREAAAYQSTGRLAGSGW